MQADPAVARRCESGQRFHEWPKRRRWHEKAFGLKRQGGVGRREIHARVPACPGLCKLSRRFECDGDRCGDKAVYRER